MFTSQIRWMRVAKPVGVDKSSSVEMRANILATIHSLGFREMGYTIIT